MQLSSLSLEAFYTCAQVKTTIEAARRLHLTQSAVSQRLKRLEDELQCSLFVRRRDGLTLTDAGHRLLRYCEQHRAMEMETLGSLRSGERELAGLIRVAGFSSVLRSVIVPALAPFLRANPKIECQFRSYEVVDLPKALEESAADMIIMDSRLSKKGVVEHLLGKEEYVVVESSRWKTSEDFYLDHGPDDNATESFFRKQKRVPPFYRRGFMGDVYGILDGVEQGLGRAVMSKHLVTKKHRVKILRGYEKYEREVVLHFFEQNYYPKIQNAIVHELRTGCSRLLR